MTKTGKKRIKKMGSSPKMPAYDQKAARQDQINAAELARKYGQTNFQGANGGYHYETDQNGNQTLVQDMSSQDRQRQNLVSGSLAEIDPAAVAKAGRNVADFNLDPTAAADAFYKNQTQYLNQDFQKQSADKEAELANRGIPVGSPQYNRAMQELADSQNRALEQAASGAVQAGQQYQTQGLNNAMSQNQFVQNTANQQANMAGSLAGQMYNPSVYSGAGGQFGGTYDAKFAADQAAAQQKANNSGGWGGLIGTVGGGLVGSLVPGVGTLAGAKLGGVVGSAF
jgi:hypothetical protein